MADVAASLTWPVTGTVPQPGDYTRISVRRCLFGPLDHYSMKRFQEEKLKEITDSCKKRWNFDFENDKPMPGPLNWELVEKEKIESDPEPTANTTAKEQTQLTKYFRKRKAICNEGANKAPKARRRST